MTTWTLTPKGYLRGRHNGRLRLQHDVVWEEHHGAIAPGFVVHHRNERKDDNRIGNLELLSALDHKRLHSPHYRMLDGLWERRCLSCRQWKQATDEHWYFHRGHLKIGRCRPCHIRAAVERKRNRKAVSV